MTTPVLVLTGFLGAGKTTLINTMLAQANGRRIAAVVNDFGSINIDEELIQSSADSVVGLSNGCICCTMQGDLLRTLKLLLAHDPAPDQIVVEASGVADPSGIIQALGDPVLWKAARLDAVICVVDAQDVTATPARRADPLWRAQLDAASFIVLSKTSDLSPQEAGALSAALSPHGKPPVIDIDRERLPDDLFFGSGLPLSRFSATETVTPLRSDRFETTEWQTDDPISLNGLQRVIADLAAVLVRAKGVLRFQGKPQTSYLLQMVGQRVTLEPATGQHDAGSRLVLISEAGRLDRAAVLARLEALTAQPETREGAAPLAGKHASA